MENTFLFLLFQLIVLIFSVMIHEISHGYVAEHLGDPTARNAGRLTLNPLKHIDPFGSVIFPALLYLASGGSFVFGWAKPVPYNPFNLKDPKGGGGKIAAAGPLSNLAVAVVFGLLLRVLPFTPYPVNSPIYMLFGYIAYINVLLAVFNMVPIPPLDGSGVLFSLLPRGEAAARMEIFLRRYGMSFLLLFMFFGFSMIEPVIRWLFRVITGF